MNPSGGSEPDAQRPNIVSTTPVVQPGPVYDPLATGPLIGNLDTDLGSTQALINSEEELARRELNAHQIAKTRSRRVKFSIMGVVLVLGLGLVLLRHNAVSSSANGNQADASQRFPVTSIPLATLDTNSPSLNVENAKTLSINGQLNVNNSLVITPSGQPSNAVAGQLYYNQQTNQLSYYNGTSFQTIVAGKQPVTVSALGGATGQVTTGNGVSVTNNVIHNTGVLSLQGETGNVTLTGGPGLVVDGTTLSNSGVLSLGGQGGNILLGSGLSLNGNTLNAQSGIQSLSAATSNVTVTDQGNGNWSIGVSVAGGSGSGTVASSGGTVGKLAMFTGVQEIEDSLVSQSGTTVTVSGSLSVTGALSLGSALSVANGGTGVNTLATNGVLIGNGVSAVSGVTAGGSGECLVSTAGAPVFQVCPGSGGVTSVNGQNGILTLQGITAGSITTTAGTITINDATSAVKGLASFNSTNLTVVNGQVNTIQGIGTTANPTFAGLSLSSALTVGNGGTGLSTLTANQLLFAGTSSSVSQVANGTAGLCLMSNGISAAPSFQTCTGAGGVNSVDGLTGALTINNSTGTGSTITISNAAANGTTKGIAAFNGTNFQDNGSGVINTIQDISTSSAPTFGQLTVTSTQNTADMLVVNNTALSPSGNLLNLKVGGSSKLSVATNGNLTGGLINGQTVGSSTSFTGTVNITGGTLTVNTISSSSALTVGVAGQAFTLQGNQTSSIKATDGVNSTTINFQDPTATVSYRFATATAGSYDVCTTAGNCVGLSGGITAPVAGTQYTLPMFSNAGGNQIANSIVSQDSAGTLLTVNGAIKFNGTLKVTNGANTTSLTATAPTANRSITIPDASGTIAVSASGPIQLDSAGNITCPTCLSTGGSGGTTGVTSLNSATGTLTLQGSDAASFTTVGTTITLNDATSTIKGLAKFNSVDLTVTSGSVDTVQGISTSSSPQFAGLTLSSPLAVASGGTGANTLASNGVVVAHGTSALTAVTGTNGQCLMIVTGAPAFGTCPGAGGGGVSSVNGLSGTLTINNVTTNGVDTITIDNAKADGVTKGIATFNGTNFQDNGSGVINTVQDIATGATPSFAGLSLTSSPLGVSSGGTGLSTLAANELLFANTGSSISQLANGTAGLCLVSNGAASAPSFQTCTGAGGVSSLNGQTGAVTLDNATGSAGHVTIQNAKADSGTTRGLASFNSTDLKDNGSGVIDTVQGIATTSTPSFAGLSLTTTPLGVGSGGTGLSVLSAFGILYASGTSSVSQLSVGTSGQCLMSNGAGVAPSWQTCPGSGGGGITGTGTSGALALFNGTSSITSSDITDTAGSNVSIASGVSLNVNGYATFKNTTNSTGAFQIQSASGSSGVLLNADTANMRLGVDVTYTSMNVPTGLAVGAATSGGSLAATTTYYYKVTAIDSAGGETTPSTEASQATTSSNKTLPVTWTAVTGASGYRVYRGTATNTEVYLTTVLTNSFTDSGSITVGTATVPAANTAYVSTNINNNDLQLSIGGNGTPTGQVYVSGSLQSSAVGSVATGSSPNGVTVSGGYAYVINGSSGTLQVFNVANPADPILVSTFTLYNGSGGGTPYSAVAQGKYLYITNNLVLEVVNISNPASPSEVSHSSQLSDVGTSIYVKGRYAYVGTWNSGQLQVFDVSNPASPVNLSTATYNGGAIHTSSIVVQGDYLYAATQSGVLVYNVANPAGPSYLSTLSGGLGLGYQSTVYVQGSYLYGVYPGGNDLAIYNISNPASPVSVGGVSTGASSSPSNVSVQGRYAYATLNGTNKLAVYDVSNPANPVLVNSVTTGSAPAKFAINGRYAYVLNQTSNTMQDFDLGGEYAQQLEAGGLTTGTLQTNGNSTFNGDVNVAGGLNLQASAAINGDLGIGGNTFLQGTLAVASGIQGGLTINQLSTPGAPTVTPTGTAGSTSYSYEIAAVSASGGITAASAAGSTTTGNATLSGSNYNQITWTAVAGAVSYNVYRTVGGATQGLIGNATTLSFNDTGLGGSTAAPSTDSSGQLTVNGFATFKNTTNSTGAFQVQSSSGVNVLSVDTTNNQVQVGNTTTYGYTRAGISQDNNVNGNYEAQSMVSGPSGGTVTSVSLYVGGNVDAINKAYKVALYANSTSCAGYGNAANCPGGWIATSAAGTLTANSWNSVSLSATLSANTLYWLVYSTNTTSSTNNAMNFNVGSFGPTTVNDMYGALTYGSGSNGGFPTTLGYSFGSNNSEYSLYVTVTGGGTGLNINSTGALTTPVVIGGSTNNVNALQIQNSVGSVLLDADTANSQLAVNGTLTARANSTAAFQVQNNSGISMLNVDTSGNIVSLGATTAAVTSTLNIATSTTGGQTVHIADGAISSGTNTITIGSGATSSGIDAVTIGSTNNTSTTSILGGTGSAAVSLAAAAGGSIVVGSSSVNNSLSIGSGTTTGTITIGGTGTTGNITIGKDSASTSHVNIGTGAPTSSSVTQFVGIGTGAADTSGKVQVDIGNGATGTGIDVVNVGGATASSTTTLQGGSTSSAVSIQALTGGTIGIGNSQSDIITIGSTTSTSPVTLQGSDMTATLTGNSSNPNFIVKTTTTDTAGAFQVQNHSGASVFSVDTSGNQAVLGANSGNKVNGKITFDNATDTNITSLSAGATGTLTTTVTGAGTGSFGHVNKATDVDDGANDNNQLGCSLFTFSSRQNATATSMTIYTATAPTGSASYGMSIYTGNGNQPTTLVANTSGGTLSSTAGANTLSISTTLTANTQYWLCANVNNATSAWQIGRPDLDPTLAWFGTQTYGSWPASITNGTGRVYSGSIAISVNYTLSTASTTNVQTVSNTGQVTVQGVNNNGSAFQVQDAAGDTILGISTGDNGTASGINIGNGSLQLTGLPNPTGVTASVASGGSLPVTCIYYAVDAVDKQGNHTNAVFANNNACVTTTSGNQTVNISWNAVPGAAAYTVYYSTTNYTNFVKDSIPAGTTNLTDNGTVFSTEVTNSDWVSPQLYVNLTTGINLQSGSAITLDGGINGTTDALINYDITDKDLNLTNFNSGGGVDATGNSFKFVNTTSYNTNFSIDAKGNVKTYSEGSIGTADGLDMYNPAGDIMLAADMYGTLQYDISNTWTHNAVLHLGSYSDSASATYGASIAMAGVAVNQLADYAEYFPQATPGQLQTGDVVCLNSSSDAESCAGAGSGDSLLGVVSTDPGYLGNNAIYNKDNPDATVIVSMMGQVPVHASAANGTIHAGDMLTYDPATGLAVKATSAGQTIGQALGNLESGTGTIQLYIHMGYYDPVGLQSDGVSNGYVIQNLDAKLANVTVDSLLVSGDITINGHIVTGGGTPTVATGTTVGTGAVVAVTGSDTSGKLTVTVGTGAAIGELVNLTFHAPFTGSAPNVTLTAGDANSALLQQYVDPTTTGFSLNAAGGTLTAGQTYTFYYHVIQ